MQGCGVLHGPHGASGEAARQDTIQIDGSDAGEATPQEAGARGGDAFVLTVNAPATVRKYLESQLELQRT
jgi:hypothetical protein